MRIFLLITITALTAALLPIQSAIGGKADKYGMYGETAKSREAEVYPLNRSQIQEMQRLLAEKGFYPGDPDGYIGTETQEAIGNFQRAEGLPITGNPDEKTLRTLAPLEKQEFFGLAPEYEGETRSPEGGKAMEH